MKAIRVTYDDGDVVSTQINGTEEEIRAYYLGKQFNVGFGPDDNLKTAVAVDFLGEANGETL